MLEWDQISLQAIQLTKHNLFHIFMVMVLADIFAGTVKAIKLKKSNSTIGINGILRHLLVIFVMVLIGIYLPLLGQETYMVTIYIYMIFQYLTSFFENWGELGLPIPTFLKETLMKLNYKMDEGSVNIKDIKEIKIISKDDVN